MCYPIYESHAGKLEPAEGGEPMPLTIVRNDITKMAVDAVVNAANTALAMGGGVFGAIFQAAGPDRLQSACAALAPISTGEAVATPGFQLPARYIIHAAGPVYMGGTQNEAGLLRSCYENALRLALKKGCESIAFPLISTGAYGYPREEALHIAVSAIGAFLEGNEMSVFLTVFDQESFALSEKLLGGVRSFIDAHYATEHMARALRGPEYAPQAAAPAEYSAAAQVFPVSSTLLRRIGHLDEPFSVTLLKLIDAKGKTDVEVYKRANLDRKLFSKIRSKKGYIPSKRTALALAVALELDLEETQDLLGRAGFTLTRSQVFDVIVEYFILKKRYDIYEINEVLFHYDQPLLGG